MDFSQKDKKYLSKNKVVKTDRVIGEGDAGKVSSVKGNKNLVVKEDHPSGYGKDSIKKEYNFFRKNNLSKEKLFAPTREVSVNSTKEKGLVRPKLKIISDGQDGVIHPSLLTKKALDTLRSQIIVLSYKGYIFHDKYQLGEDNLRRIMNYDFGGIQKVSTKTVKNINHAFSVNNREWKRLEKDIGKNIGKIERSAQLDAVYLTKKETVDPKKAVKSKSKNVKKTQKTKISKQEKERRFWCS